MKKFIYIFIIFFALSSCEVFDTAPQESISDQGAISSASGLQAALGGLYSQMQDSYYGGDIFFLGDVSSDIAQSVGTWDFYREMDTYFVASDNTEVLDLWDAIYEVVNQANNIIESAPNVTDASQALINQSLGEAYFARGMAFFDAAKVWGGIPGVIGDLGVPLPLEPSREATFPSRASLDATYDQVEADLNQALNLLPEVNSLSAPDGNNRDRANKAAVRALLARYHLYMGNYAQASDFASQVINDSKYALVENYADIFQGENTSESIFELQFNNADQSGLRFWYAPGALGGRGELAAHDDFYNAIPDNDARKALYGFDEVGDFVYPTKYFKAGDIDNAHVIRLAEMYLIRAEADLFESKGDPTADVNAIRTRAGLDPLDGPVTLDDILNERKVELAFEGHRWFDLIRTGKALEVLASVPRTNTPGDPAALTDANRQLFPIPNLELNANANLVQNAAYR